MAPYFKGFPNFEVVVQAALAFVLHCLQDFKILLVECVWAAFIMLGNTRVVPLPFVDGTFMFLPSCVKGAVGLANIGSCGGAGAGVTIDAFLLVLRWFCLVAIA